jgi:hypothetical protein
MHRLGESQLSSLTARHCPLCQLDLVLDQPDTVRRAVAASGRDSALVERVLELEAHRSTLAEQAEALAAQQDAINAEVSIARDLRLRQRQMENRITLSNQIGILQQQSWQAERKLRDALAALCLAETDLAIPMNETCECQDQLRHRLAAAGCPRRFAGLALGDIEWDAISPEPTRQRLLAYVAHLSSYLEQSLGLFLFGPVGCG